MSNINLKQTKEIIVGRDDKVRKVHIGNGHKFALMAGPCVIESREMVLDIASSIKAITDELGIPYIFKASFDKANRTSITSFRGPGIEKGMEILAEVRDTLGLPVVTDIHEPWQCEVVASTVDMIQIPAFLCRQTDLLVAAAKTGLPVNVKKGQFLAPWDMRNVVNKLNESGSNNILLCERGSTFGYNNLIVDMRSLLEMREFGYPVIFDATHSVQKPGGMGDKTSGDSKYAYPLMRAAASIGIDGIFAEVHPDPTVAKSDGPNMIKLDELQDILVTISKIDNIIKGN